MINSNDGGGNVSINGGETWTGQAYATAQLYHVATTHELPYHVCGAQQDNSTICVSSVDGGRGGGGGGGGRPPGTFAGGRGANRETPQPPPDPPLVFPGQPSAPLPRLRL